MAVITDREYNHLLAANKELQERRDKELIKPFVDEFKEALATVLASIPFDEWPDSIKDIFEYVRNKGYQIAADKYKERLPTRPIPKARVLNEFSSPEEMMNAIETNIKNKISK